jgi:hypothetical protein
MAKNALKLTIGRCEYVELPQLDSVILEAKIDTGAYTSALHGENVRIYDNNGQQWVDFDIPQPGMKPPQFRSFQLPVHKIKRIRSSNGITEIRCVVKTSIRIGTFHFKAEFSLADRSSMQYPVLLGRKALKNRFLVDVSQKHLLTK